MSLEEWPLEINKTARGGISLTLGSDNLSSNEFLAGAIYGVAKGMKLPVSERWRQMTEDPIDDGHYFVHCIEFKNLTDLASTVNSLTKDQSKMFDIASLAARQL